MFGSSLNIKAPAVNVDAAEVDVPVNLLPVIKYPKSVPFAVLPSDAVLFLLTPTLPSLFTTAPPLENSSSLLIFNTIKILLDVELGVILALKLVTIGKPACVLP